MTPIVNILHDRASIAALVSDTMRPAQFIRTGGLWLPADAQGQLLVDNQAIAANAYLTREEWETLDGVVYPMARQKLNAYGDLLSEGLTRQGSLAVMHTKWSVGSERIAADVTLDFRTQRTLDRVDRHIYGVPVPIISAEFRIGRRELLVARTAGQQIDTVNATEAAAAVGEMLEEILMNGNTTAVIEGNTIPGYTSLAARDTATAAVYGGGDFGVLSNIRPTFTGMLAALAAKRYRGPFRCYVASTQYHQMLARHSDGSGQTALDTVLELPQIKSVEENDLLAAASVIMSQMSRDVVDVEIAMELEVRQWVALDGSQLGFVVMASAVPRLKTDHAGNAGIAHATSA